MCIGCTFNYHWRQVYRHLKNNSSIEGLPGDIQYRMQAAKDYSIKNQIDVLDALKILFLENHSLNNPDPLQMQKHDDFFLEELWLQINN